MSTRITVEITEDTLREIVLDYLRGTLNADLTEKDVTIETKSKQNYRAEWESAAFRARVNKYVP